MASWMKSHILSHTERVADPRVCLASFAIKKITASLHSVSFPSKLLLCSACCQTHMATFHLVSSGLKTQPLSHSGFLMLNSAIVIIGYWWETCVILWHGAAGSHTAQGCVDRPNDTITAIGGYGMSSKHSSFTTVFFSGAEWRILEKRPLEIWTSQSIFKVVRFSPKGFRAALNAHLLKNVNFGSTTKV